MRWTDSGILNYFEYETLGVFPPYQSTGTLEGVTGGKITRQFNSDYRESLSLDIDGEEPPLGSLVRVWHTAQKDGETVRECLGTFMRTDSSVTYRAGRYVGSLSFQSLLLKQGTDKRGNNRNVGAGTNVLTFAQSIVENSGGVLSADPTLSTSKTFSSTHVWEYGESVLEELQRCADALNAIVGVDPYGTVTLKPYILPSKRAFSWSLTTDEIVEGLKRDDPDIVNIVHVQYSAGGNQYYASAQLAAGNEWSRNALGRFVAKTYNINELSAGSVQAQANLYMSQVDMGRSWSISMPYMPLEIGSRGALVYMDGGEGVVKDCTIQSMEFDLDAAMLTKLVLKEV